MPTGSKTRQRNTARSKSRGARSLRRSVSAPNLEADAQEEVFHDDEEPNIGKTLHAKDGKVLPIIFFLNNYFISQLGFITSKGFVGATNFLVDIEAQVHSEKYVIKGVANSKYI